MCWIFWALHFINISKTLTAFQFIQSHRGIDVHIQWAHWTKHKIMFNFFCIKAWTFLHFLMFFFFHFVCDYNNQIVVLNLNVWIYQIFIYWGKIFFQWKFYLFIKIKNRYNHRTVEFAICQHTLTHKQKNWIEQFIKYKIYYK